MIKKISFFLLLLPIAIQAQNHFITDVGLRVLLSDQKNTFWSHSNTNGLIQPNTNFLGTVNTEFSNYVGEYGRLAIGASAFYAVNKSQDDTAALNEYYAFYEYQNVKVTLGAKNRDEKLMGLSSVGGDMLWSSNARAIPGIEFATIAPLEFSDYISLDFALGHYLLNDDRHVENARVHYKKITLNLNTSENSVFSLGLSNYAQWGGVSKTAGQQPDSANDFLKILFSTTETTKVTRGYEENPMGNFIGSFHLDYKYQFRNRDKLHLYYQSIYEDTSGREFANFPDGVWGAFWSTSEEDSFIKGFLYEYQHTISQSGPSLNRYNDNYFNNNIYQSGWTYFGEVIGTPFITPNPDGIGIINNTYRAHHVGVTGRLFNLDYKGKASYVVNKGLIRAPFEPSQNNLYVYGDLTYNASERSSFSFSLAGDIRDAERDRLTVGLGFRYRIGRKPRYIYRRD
ncbi:capsule assembly Wzi family protein [Arenibacter certesii]|uniref:DUF5723 domain-containing protein n=1 Tax=Arenibacter certesii TaxID=228955 RepID=A0A918ILH3_9FLAO|nr:capsule assembly Wzi family protein [Arenibacter certesii]GGW22097.1 hypothetical protein GCM10007383_01490 [Arenibacter certesii]